MSKAPDPNRWQRKRTRTNCTFDPAFRSKALQLCQVLGLSLSEWLEGLGQEEIVRLSRRKPPEETKNSP